MNLISSALFKWYVPRSHHESLKTLAHSYLEQLEGCENEIQQAKRTAEANKLLASKAQAVGKLLLGEEIPLANVETDEFYDRIDLEARILRANNQRYYLHLHKIGAIALQDQDFESSLGSVSKGDADRIVEAIESLRQEVADLQKQLEEVKGIARGYVNDLTELRGEKIQLVSRSATIASRIRDEVNRLVNSSLPL